MTLRPSIFTWARAAVVAAAGLSVPSAFAVGEPTTYAQGDLFIGFRQAGVSNTLSVSIGGATKYIPIEYGGTWDGQPFQVRFGLVPAGNPGAGTPVFSLAPDLAAVFGANWAENPAAEDGSGVRWSVAGITSTTADNVPIAGFGASTIFLTKAETTPGERSATLANFSANSFQVNFTGFTSGISDSSYTGRISTNNSNAAYIGASSGGDNWGTRIGAAGSSWGTGRVAEQALNGPFSGPTDSVLDLYVRAGANSTELAPTSRAYLGSFDLAPDGTMTYSLVPEPGSAALLSAGGALLGLRRRRRPSAPASLA